MPVLDVWKGSTGALEAGQDLPHLKPKSWNLLGSSGEAAPPSTEASNASPIRSWHRRLSVATVVGYQACSGMQSRQGIALPPVLGC